MSKKKKINKKSKNNNGKNNFSFSDWFKLFFDVTRFIDFLDLDWFVEKNINTIYSQI